MSSVPPHAPAPHVLPLPAALRAADPLDLYRRLLRGADEGPSFLLDGGAAAQHSRYSYMGVEPYAWLEVTGRSFQWRGPGVARLAPAAREARDPFDALAAALASGGATGEGGTRPVDDLPPFRGGAVGFLGYEMGGWLERLPPPKPSGGPLPDRVGGPLPDMVIGLYDVVLAMDHVSGEAWIIATPAHGGGAAVARAAMWLQRLSVPPAAALAAPTVRPPGWRAATTRAGHESNVARTVDYIRAGDIFQANITQRFLASVAPGVGAVDVYARVRAATRAPHAALLELGGGRALVSGSPERFIALDAAGVLETRPIKGTRPRGADGASDAALAAELLASPKDRAENLMIVDLLRNDLARVAKVGSVAVPTLCGLESYATVHHLVSVVTARLAPGLGPVDVLRATFPGGSITGAPKVRTMEIIHELESAPRGPYCGSVVWLGWDGAMDSSIIIRTLVLSPSPAEGGGVDVVLQAGGGIVADSDPAAEYEESLVKARALMRAIDPHGPLPGDPLPGDDDAGGML